MSDGLEEEGKRNYEAYLDERRRAHETHQKERDVLFSNEAFVIGVLQAVSGGSLFAALAQTQALTNLAGSLALLAFITLMGAGLTAAVCAAFWKHHYKMWDVKSRVSESEAEASKRSRKSQRYLVSMRKAMFVSITMFVLGVGELLTVSWVRALRPLFCLHG